MARSSDALQHGHRVLPCRFCSGAGPPNVLAEMPGDALRIALGEKAGFPASGFHTIERGNQKVIFYCLLGGEIKLASQQGPF
jgi:hypothetical protein